MPRLATSDASGENVRSWSELASAEVKSDYERARPRYKRKRWTEQNLKAMARKVGWEDLYDELYAPHSTFVHGGPMSAVAYFVPVEGGFRLREDVDLSMCNGILVGACVVAARALAEVHDAERMMTFSRSGGRDRTD